MFWYPCCRRPPCFLVFVATIVVLVGSVFVAALSVFFFIYCGRAARSIRPINNRDEENKAIPKPPVCSFRFLFLIVSIFGRFPLSLLLWNYLGGPGREPRVFVGGVGLLFVALGRGVGLLETGRSILKGESGVAWRQVNQRVVATISPE